MGTSRPYQAVDISFILNVWQVHTLGSLKPSVADSRDNTPKSDNSEVLSFASARLQNTVG